MQHNSINGFVKTGETIRGSRVVYEDGFQTTRLGDQVIALVEGAANVTRAGGDPPVGISIGHPAESHVANNQGGERPIAIATEGQVNLVTAFAYDPTNPAHRYVTTNADGEAVATAHDGANWIVARTVGTVSVDIGGLIPVVIDIR